MPPNRRIARLSTASVLALSLALSPVGGFAGLANGAPRPNPAVAPSVTVTPSTHLRNHEKVTVAGRHFPAHASLVMVECNPKVGRSGSAACDDLTATFVTANASGAFSGKRFEVVTGKVGNGSCGTAKSLTCDLEVSLPTPSSKVHAVGVLHFARP